MAAIRLIDDVADFDAITVIDFLAKHQITWHLYSSDTIDMGFKRLILSHLQGGLSLASLYP